MKTGIYKHYKGHIYRVMLIGKHTETLENMVIYQAINAENSCEKASPDTIWVRPEKMFSEHVIVDVNSVPRFTYLEEMKNICKTNSGGVRQLIKTPR